MSRIGFWRTWMTAKEFRATTLNTARARALATMLAGCLNRLDELDLELREAPANAGGGRTIEIIDIKASEALATVEEWPLLRMPWTVKR